MHGTSRFNGARSVSPSPRSGGRSHDRPGAGAGRGDADAEHTAPREACIHLRLPVDVESVAAAHHSVFGIASALDPVTLDDIRLLISELVTNALRHARLGPADWIDLEVDIADKRIRVEVRDPGPGFDPATIPVSKRPETPGWGLFLLRQIASRWGVERDAVTCVWFELDLHPATGDNGSAPGGHG